MNLLTRRLVIALASFVALTLIDPRPAAAAPAKSVICKDGTTDEGGRGACSGHGGIDKIATEKAEASKAAAAKEEKAKARKEKAEKAKQDAAEKAEKVEKAKQDAGAKAEETRKPATHAAEKPAAATETKAAVEKADPAKGPPTARCKDGTLSYAVHHSGACSNHGGVGEWLDKK